MSKHASPYQSIPAVLEKVAAETSNIKTFWLRPEEPVPFRTGQFVVHPDGVQLKERRLHPVGGEAVRGISMAPG